MNIFYTYLEAPNYDPNINWFNSVFLAGSISGATDWQKSVAKKLLPYFNVINPRRYNPKHIKEETVKQITWEFKHLQYCNILLFHFRPETVAPITLFEYGKWLSKLKDLPLKKIYVAIHPDYPRKNDVIIQTQLENSALVKNITFSLNKTIQQIIKENKQ